MTARVLHVLPHRGGGAETYIDMVERVPGYVHTRFPLSVGRSPASAIGSIPRRWPLLARTARSVDLVHAHGDITAILALPLLSRRPSVVTTHGLHLLRRSIGARRTAMRHALRGVAAAAQIVICTSEAERAELEPLVRFRDRPKLRVLYNGVNPPQVAQAFDREALRRELGADPGTVLGLFAGELEARKQPLLAARAAAQARAQGAPFVLALAGEGPQATELRGLGSDAVKPLGYRRDLDRLYAAADVFVQTSEREGMSLALLEAMCSGLAVVTSDGPGNPEAVGDAGLVVATGDQRGLVSALVELSTNPELRNSLGERARARAVGLFGAERFLVEIERLYGEARGAQGA